jgi:hypothetical protein
MKLIIDKWNGNRNEGTYADAKNGQEAVKALQTLNGKNITQLIASDDNGTILIGGGPELFVVTYMEGDNEAFFTVINPDFPDDETEVTLVTGAQAGDFPKKVCVGFDLAALVLSHYVDKGEQSPAVIWEEEE